MNTWWRRLLGRSRKNEKILDEKAQEAHQIKNSMTKDVLRIQKKVDKINLHTNQKLNEVSEDLKSVTYRIAVATGGKKRGLK